MEYQNHIVQGWQMNGNDEFNRANLIRGAIAFYPLGKF